MPITILLNDQPCTLTCGMSLTQALTLWELMPNTFAIAINESFISKVDYDEIFLREGDRIEIVTAMQGG